MARTLVIELPDELEQQLLAQAAEGQVSPEAWVLQFISQRLRQAQSEPSTAAIGVGDRKELMKFAGVLGSGQGTEIDNDAIDEGTWQFLVARPHGWRRQLYMKGHKLRAATVWQDLLVNQMTVEEAVDNWDLPVAAIREAVQYCEANRELLRLEAAEELLCLQAAGVGIEPVSTH